MAVLDRGWRRIVTEIGIEFLLDEAVEAFRAAGQQVEGENGDPRSRSSCSSRWPRRRASSTCRRATPSRRIHLGGQHMAFASVYGCPFVREGDDAPRGDDGRLREPRAPVAGLPRARLAGRHDLRAQRQAAGLAPPRHGLRAADAVGQALHGLGDLGPERRGHDRDGGDPLRRARGDRGHAGVAVAHQRQLAAALRRPHAQRAASPTRRPTRPTIITPFLLMGAMSPVSIPATLAQQMAEALAGIALDAAHPPGLPGRLRLVPLEHRHAVGLAVVRHARVGHRPAVHRADRALLRAAVALGRRR